ATYRSKSDVWSLADPILATVNRGSAAEGGLTITEFSERYFLPFINAKKKPATYKFYKDLFENHFRDRVGYVRLRDFTARHAQEVLDANSSSLTHSSIMRIKTGLSATFSHAIRLGFILGANPAREAKAEGKRSDPQLHAYTIAEIEAMLKTLDEPARTVCGVAAFAGLRESEIRGLQRSDYDGNYLHVRRAVWRVHVGETKTPDSKSSVPVITPLRKLLDAHVRRNGEGEWLFTGERKGFALNLDNLAARTIRPALGDRWKGWHAFRRGLATNLFTLGVAPEVVQTILRHSDAATTRKHYILLKSQEEGRAAMTRLEKAVTKSLRKRVGQGMGKAQKRRMSLAPS
ncbi:MAG: tyrosine-type recombinase/integrase, partial [Candidatus Sulfotelmatobacter sp.]